MPTDLERLHKTHELLINYGSYERRAGKTTYHCHQVAGQLMVSPPGSVIVVVVEYYDRVQHFIPMLLDILEEYGITDYSKPINKYEITFATQRLRVEFVSVEDMFYKLRGYDRDQQLIMDIERLPSYYFSNPILRGELWELMQLKERILSIRRAYDTPSRTKWKRSLDTLVALPRYIN